MAEKDDRNLNSEDFDDMSFGNQTFADIASEENMDVSPDEEAKPKASKPSEQKPKKEAPNQTKAQSPPPEEDSQIPEEQEQDEDNQEHSEEEEFKMGYTNLQDSRLASKDNNIKPLPSLGEMKIVQVSDDPFDQAMELVEKGKTGELVDDFNPYDDDYKENLESLLNIKFDLILEIGRARMKISDILLLGQGSVIELQKLVGEDLNIMVNDKWIARGEVVICRERFGTRITHILSQEERLKKLGTTF